LLFQGGITVLATVSRQLFTEEITRLVSATGGVLIMAIGLSLLGTAEIDVINLMPALILVVVLSRVRNKLVTLLRA
ncbi:DUF554 family protein, partial [Litorivivens sp.]